MAKRLKRETNINAFIDSTARILWQAYIGVLPEPEVIKRKTPSLEWIRETGAASKGISEQVLSIKISFISF